MVSTSFYGLHASTVQKFLFESVLRARATETTTHGRLDVQKLGEAHEIATSYRSRADSSQYAAKPGEV